VKDKVIFSKDSKWFNGEKDYMPHCLNCSTMGRLTRTKTGTICLGEGDYFGRVGCGETFDISEESLIKFEEINGEKWLKETP
jgi:hypothetical protein